MNFVEYIETLTKLLIFENFLSCFFYTADGYSVRHRDVDSINDNDSLFDEQKDSEANITATPPSTPTKMEYNLENNLDDEKFSKTPQIAADLFQRYLV